MQKLDKLCASDSQTVWYLFDEFCLFTLLFDQLETDSPVCNPTSVQ